jgi:hypothetical protein
VLPLPLPLGNLRVEALRFGTTIWDVDVHYGGHAFLGIRIDDGPLLIESAPPAACSDGRRHAMTVVYA